MLDYIKSISERCYNTAVKRGKDVTQAGCLQAIVQEYIEFERARVCKDFSRLSPVLLSSDSCAMSDAQFEEVYAKHLHNTIEDEVADVIITAATWCHTNGGKNPKAAEIIAAEAREKYLSCGSDELLRATVTLKMRYNEVRQD